jgi:hypothetical protein
MFEMFASDWRELWVGNESQESVGAIFTKPEIVELILDVAGYSAADKRLSEFPLLEPSCGDGAFLTVAVSRLIESERLHTREIDWDSPRLSAAIRAADINILSVRKAKALVVAALADAGCAHGQAKVLADNWIVEADFLLGEWPNRFEFVIGNPPYVRLEDVPKRVMLRYRELYKTLTDRADLYIAFFERGLQLLSNSGTLAFICANRFTKNKYGEALRRMVADKYHVRNYINLEHTQPFLTDVSAYPAIVVIDRERGKPTRAATLSDIDPETIAVVRRESVGKHTQKRVVSHFDSWYPNGEPWLTTSGTEHGVLDSLNRSLPTLEASAPNTKVGIGVATGADEVYVLKEKHPEIEESRQIPLLMAANVGNDGLRWSGRFLLNPFADEDDGSLVRLRDYPGVAMYLETHGERLKKRHVARNRPTTWFRTIDRIWPSLQRRPKLVIPDIQGSTVIGYDAGEFYPHHNLYFITSGSWPLLALKALLRSEIVYQQVRAYSVQMRGGSVRFQAQTLRKVRIPSLHTLSDEVLSRLIAVSECDDKEALDDAAKEAFALATGSSAK